VDVAWLAVDVPEGYVLDSGSFGEFVCTLVGSPFFILVRLSIAGVQIRLTKISFQRYVAGFLRYLSQTLTVVVAT
jgi:hypothetical protein